MDIGEVGSTIGVEEEFHLLDAGSGELVPAARQLLRVDPDSGEPEMRPSMIETASDVCRDLDELRRDLAERRRTLRDAAAEVGLAVAATGTVPDSGLGDARVYPTARYEWMADEYRQLVAEHQVCACQVQIGVPDRDLALRLIRRLRPWLPTLLALSGSSPFFAGRDTGYASYRAVVISRWPSAGPPPEFDTAEQYEHTVSAMVTSGVLRDPGMIYFDARPSARYPTIEIRAADACPLLDDVVLIAALSRALVVTAAEEEAAGVPVRPLPDPLLRGATWRSARSGLTGELVDPLTARAEPASVRARALLTYVRPVLEARGEWAVATELLDALLARGASAQRQRAALARHGSIRPVVDEVVAETAAC
jgi:carboxylate-amine ligase